MVFSLFTSKPSQSPLMSCAILDAEQSPRCGREEVDLGWIQSKVAKRSARRCVSFLVDELDRDLVDVIEYEKAPLECQTDLYYTDDEKNYFIADAKESIVNFIACHSPAIESLEKAYINCTVKHVSDEEYREDMHNLMLWVTSKARGFEETITPLLWDQRRQSIREIIEFAAHLKEASSSYWFACPSVDEELRLFCVHRSQRPAEFALKLAMADELTL